MRYGIAQRLDEGPLRQRRLRTGRWSVAAVLFSLSSLAVDATAQTVPTDTPTTSAPPQVPTTPSGPVGEAQPKAAPAALEAPNAGTADPEPRFAAFADQIGISGGLTSEQVARRAADTSVDAAAARHRVAEKAAQVDKTFYGLTPRLTFTARYTRLSPISSVSLVPEGGAGGLVATTAPPGPLDADAPLFSMDTSALSFPVLLNNTLFNLGLTIPLSDYLFSTVQAVRGSKAARRAAEIEERAARVAAGAQAKLTYYDWVRARLQRVVVQQSLEQARSQLERLRNYLAAGRVAEADVLQSQAFVAEAELAVHRANTAVQLAEQQMRIAMHAEAHERFEIGEDVLTPLPPYPGADSLEELYREALARRLEIRSLDETEYSLQQAVQVQEAQRLPRVEAFGNVTYSNPNQRVFPQEDEFRATWDVGVQLVWTINDVPTWNAEAAITESQRQVILTQKASIQDALRMEILSAQSALKEAQLAVTTAEQGQRAADAAFEARLLLQQHGRATTFELLQAETARLEARLRFVEAHVSARAARARLDHAVGRDTAAVN